jgi:hypothetical protein
MADPNQVRRVGRVRMVRIQRASEEPSHELFDLSLAWLAFFVIAIAVMLVAAWGFVNRGPHGRFGWSGIRRTAILLVKSIDDRPKLVGAISACRTSPRCSPPEQGPDANQRDANYDEWDAQSSHARERQRPAL